MRRAALGLLLFPSVCLGLTGRVEDPVGAPIDGAEIVWVDAGGEEGAGAATDEEGRFALDAPLEAELRVSAEGFLAKEITAAEDPLIVRLVPSVMLRLRVVDEEGHPLQDAEVALYETAHAERADDAEPLREARTDDAGRISFASMAPSIVWIDTEAEDFETDREGPVALRPPVETRIVSLQPALVVTGRILDAEGEPIPGAEVGFLASHPREGRPDPYIGQVVRDWTEADAKGRYRLSRSLGWPPYRGVSVAARAPGRAPAFVKRDRFDDSRTLRWDLVPGAAAFVEGRIVDEDGVGVAGVELRARLHPEIQFQPSGERRTSEWIDLASILPDGVTALRSGEEGVFRLGPLPAGGIRLAPWSEGRPFEWPETQLEIEPGQVITDITIEWRAGRTLAGEVVDEAGEPIEGAELEVLEEGFRGPSVLANTTTATDGRFRLEGLEGESVERLLVRASGFGTRVLRDLTLDGEKRTIRLRPSGSLSGRVFDAGTGAPVAAFVLDLEPHRKGSELRGEAKEEEISDPEGTFLLKDVTPGTYELEVRSPTHVGETLDEVEVRVAEETPLPPIHLEPGRTIRGLVLDAQTQEPVEGASTTTGFSRQTFGGHSDQTDGDGRFEIQGIGDADVTLYVSHTGYTGYQSPVEFQEGQRVAERTVELSRGGSISVTVFDVVGEPVQGAFVSLHAVEQKARGANGATDGEGRAQFEHVTPGRYLVRRERSAQAEETTVREGETSEVVLEPEGALLYGTVSWRGAPYENAAIYLVRGQGGFGFGRGDENSWRTDATVEGARWEAGPVPPGPVEVTALGEYQDPEDPNRRASLGWSEQIDVPQDVDRIRQDIVLPDRSVRGRVIRSDTGEGVDEVILYLRIGSEPAGMAVTTENGSFEMFPRATGRGEIKASYWEGLPGFKAEGTPVVVPEDGPLEGVILRLVPGTSIAGTVHDSNGRPLPEVQVGWSSMNPNRTTLSMHGPVFFQFEGDPKHLSEGNPVITDSDGAYRLTGLEEGPGILLAAHLGHAPAWIELEVRDEEVHRDLVLHEGGKLTIHLPEGWQDSEDKSLRAIQPGLLAPLLLLHGEGMVGYGYQKMPSPGELVISHLPAGTWTLEAVMDGVTHRAVVEIEDGGEAEVEL